jgi:hypothetical protein
MKLSVSGGVFGIEVVSDVWFVGVKLLFLILRIAETMGGERESGKDGMGATRGEEGVLVLS